MKKHLSKKNILKPNQALKLIFKILKSSKKFKINSQNSINIDERVLKIEYILNAYQEKYKDLPTLKIESISVEDGLQNLERPLIEVFLKDIFRMPDYQNISQLCSYFLENKDIQEQARIMYGQHPSIIELWMFLNLEEKGVLLLEKIKFFDLENEIQLRLIEKYFDYFANNCDLLNNYKEHYKKEVALFFNHIIQYHPNFINIEKNQILILKFLKKHELNEILSMMQKSMIKNNIDKNENDEYYKKIL